MNNDKKQNKDNNKQNQGEDCPTQEPVIGARTAGTAEGDEKTIDKALKNDKNKR